MRHQVIVREYRARRTPGWVLLVALITGILLGMAFGAYLVDASRVIEVSVPWYPSREWVRV